LLSGKQRKAACTACHDPHSRSTAAETVAKTKPGVRNLSRGKLPSNHPAKPDAFPATCRVAGRGTPFKSALRTIAFSALSPIPLPVKEVHDGNTLPYAGEVKLYYPAHAEGPELAIAQVKTVANLPAESKRWRSWPPQLKPPRPTYRSHWPKALYGNGPRERADCVLPRCRGIWNPATGGIREWAGNGDAGAEPGLSGDETGAG